MHTGDQGRNHRRTFIRIERMLLGLKQLLKCTLSPVARLWACFTFPVCQEGRGQIVLLYQRKGENWHDQCRGSSLNGHVLFDKGVGNDSFLPSEQCNRSTCCYAQASP